MLAKKNVVSLGGSYRSKKLSKSPRQLERHMKGVANHRRIEILFLKLQTHHLLGL